MKNISTLWCGRHLRKWRGRRRGGGGWMASRLRRGRSIGRGGSSSGRTTRATSIDHVVGAGRLVAMVMKAMFVLAEDLTPEQRDQILFWGFVLMGLAIVGFVAIMIIKRRMMAAGEGENA